MAPMKKTFPLQQPGKADARVRDAIKHDVRKYVIRERRKPLPDETDTWVIACRVGADDASASRQELKAVSSAIDAVAATGATAVFIEIMARAGRRSPGPA